MIRRLLFVDDEPHVLEGLRHRLHRQRHEWDMAFVESGEAAMETLARSAIDVVVTDLRMPRMDGATLLQHVRERHPHVVRIVLSGHAELETSLRAVDVAHQFLTKPDEPGVLENVIERACRLQDLVNDDRIRRLVGRVEHLPSMPRVYAQIRSALARETVSAGQVAEILKQDMGICAKILQVVNSAFFRLSRTVVEIEEAVAYLGFHTIQQIAMAVEVFQQSRGSRVPSGLSLERQQHHALLVATVASKMCGDKRTQEDAFVAGLLHDIGKLVLAVEWPDYVALVQNEVMRSACTVPDAEHAALGASHAEVGAYLLGLWGLPYPVIEAVAYHHTPWHVDHHDMGMLAATYMANVLVHEGDPDAGPAPATLDAGYLERLGLTGRIEGWRNMAVREVARHAIDVS